jgi:hypothetical protein
MISIKITGLLDMRVLKRINDGIELRDHLWKTQNEDGWLTYEGLLTGLRKIYSAVSDEQVEQYLKAIHNNQGAPQ